MEKIGKIIKGRKYQNGRFFRDGVQRAPVLEHIKVVKKQVKEQT